MAHIANLNTLDAKAGEGSRVQGQHAEGLLKVQGQLDNLVRSCLKYFFSWLPLYNFSSHYLGQLQVSEKGPAEAQLSLCTKHWFLL